MKLRKESVYKAICAGTLGGLIITNIFNFHLRKENEQLKIEKEELKSYAITAEITNNHNEAEIKKLEEELMFSEEVINALIGIIEDKTGDKVVIYSEPYIDIEVNENGEIISGEEKERPVVYTYPLPGEKIQ